MSDVPYTLVAGAAPVSGAERFYRALVAGAAHVVAADAAGEWAVALGRVPDLVVGDFDSAACGARTRLESLGTIAIPYPAAKDETDLELAVDAARDRYGDRIVLTAAFTGRLDHTLAALGALARAGRGAVAEEPDWQATLVSASEPLDVLLPTNTTFSVVPLGAASGVSVSGATWPLTGADLPSLGGRGVSNLSLGGPVRIRVTEGLVLVVATRDPAQRYTLR